MEKSGGKRGGGGECGEDVVELFTRERRSLDILSVKKEAKLSASELAEVKEGNVMRIYGVIAFDSLPKTPGIVREGRD